MQLGTLVFRVDPQYPKKIGRSEVEIVKLMATVGENGQVTDVQRLSGSPPFATAAISAIREWKYSPTLFDGRPVKTEDIEINLFLDGERLVRIVSPSANAEIIRE